MVTRIAPIVLHWPSHVVACGGIGLLTLFAPQSYPFLYFYHLKPNTSNTSKIWRGIEKFSIFFERKNETHSFGLCGFSKMGVRAELRGQRRKTKTPPPVTSQTENVHVCPWLLWTSLNTNSGTVALGPRYLHGSWQQRGEQMPTDPSKPTANTSCIRHFNAPALTFRCCIQRRWRITPGVDVDYTLTRICATK